MAGKNNGVNGAANGSVPDSDNPQRRISVNAQYIKDLSFENPNAPNSFFKGDKPPQINVNVNVGASNVGENAFEVVLHMGVESKRDDIAIFIMELAYAGVFTLSSVPEEDLEQILLIFCPGVLFPFARRIIADATQDGGFPPLLVDPIDFSHLYAQRAAESKESA